jgi:hypothetical protein
MHGRETVFSTWSVPTCYKPKTRLELSVEGQLVKRSLGGWCEMAASLGVICTEAVGREATFAEDLSTEEEEQPLLEAVTK